MELRVEDLIGKEVLDVDGERAGRIEEIVVARDGLRRVVTEVHLGPAALLERLSAPFRGEPQGKRVPWSLLDLSDAEHPKIRCARTALAPLDPPKRPDLG